MLINQAHNCARIAAPTPPPPLRRRTPPRATPSLQMVRRSPLGRKVSRSCGGPQERVPKPCVPAEQIACRPPTPAAPQHAVRVVCCPPPPSAHPPCAPPPRAAPLSCASRAPTIVSRKTFCEASSAPAGPCRRAPSGLCAAGQDRVARRLAAAREARRADYEREVARRVPAPAAPESSYSLGEDRVCARATDGRQYSLPSAPGPGRCGPHRTPPPPRCDAMPSDRSCRISDGRLDSCARSPRFFVEIDRSAPPAPAAPPAPPPPEPAVTRCASSPASASAARSLTSRIVDGIGRGRGAGDRGLHTSAAVSRAAPVPLALGGSGSERLDDTLRARAALKEVGRGRVVSRGAAPSRASGNLELPVPDGVERVVVTVAMVGALAAKPASTPVLPVDSLGRGEATRAGGMDSCLSLSIKTVEKRFAGCRSSDRNDNVREVRTPSSPCAPKRSETSTSSPCVPKRSETPTSSPCSPKHSVILESPCGPKRSVTLGSSCGPKRSVSPEPNSCGGSKPSYPSNLKKCSSSKLTVTDDKLILV